MAEQAVWIVQGGGPEPLTVSQLREKLEAGELSPEAQVQHVKLPTWIPIVAVKGLSDLVQRQRVERASARPAAQQAGESSWMIAVDGKQDGPMTRAELVRRGRRAMVHGDTLVWREGMRGWMRLDEVPELSGVLPPPESITETGRMRVLTREEAKARLEKATPKTIGECRRFLERNPEHEPTLQVLETFVRTDKDAQPAVELLESVLAPRGEWQRLMAAWRNLLRTVRDPEARTDLRMRMGQAAEGPLESPRQAFAVFASALRESPRREDVHEALLRLADHQDDLPGLMALLDEQIAGHEGKDRAALLMFAARLDLERRDDAPGAAARLTEAARLDPSATALATLEQIGERTGDWWPWAEGLRAAAEQAEGEEKVAHLHQLANALQVRLDRPVRAVAVYGEILAVAADDLQTRDALKRLHKRGVAPDAVYPLLAGLWEAEQDWAALRDLQAAHLPHHAPGQERAAALFALATLCHERLGDAEAAVGWLRQAVRQAPSEASYREALLDRAAEQGTLPAAAAVLEKLVEEHPSLQVELAWALFDLYGRRGQDAAAAEVWGRRAVEAADVASLPARLDELAAWSGLAIIALERLVAATPAGAERTALHLRLARAHRDRGEAAAAVRSYQALLADDAEHEVALDELAALHADAGDWDAWLGVRLGRADATSRDDERLALWRDTARTLADQLGRHAEAADLWRRVLAAAPGDADALDGLEALSAAQEDWAGLADVLERRRAGAEGEAAHAVTRRLAVVYVERLADRARAAACYRSLLRAFPEDANARRGLARTAEGPEALAAWLTLFEADAADVEAAEALAALHLAAGAPGAHVAVRLRHLATVADDGKAVPALRALAAFCAEHDLQEATAVLQALVARQPDDAEAAAALARQFAAQEDWPALARSLDTQIASATGAVRAGLRRQLAELQATRLGRPEAAFGTLLTAFDEAADPGLLSELARLAALTDAWPRLVQYVERGLHEAAPEVAVDLHRRLGEWHAGPLDDAERAVEHFGQVLALAPADPASVAALETLFADGRARARIVALLDPVLSAAGRWDALAELLADTLPARGPARVEALRRLGQIHEAHLAAPREAMDFIALALEAAPGDAGLLADLLRLAGHLDRHDLAADAMTRALFVAEQPADVVALGAALAPVLADLGQRVRALRVYTRILDADPRHPEALAALDAAAEEQGDLEELASILQRRIAATTDAAERRGLRERLAAVCRARGRDDEAVGVWTAVLQRDPEDADALAALDELHRELGEWEALVAIRQRRLAVVPAAERAALRADLADVLETRLDRPEQAAEVLLALVGDEGETPERFDRLVQLLRAEGRWAELEQLAEQRLPAPSAEREIELLSLMAEAQTALERPRDALESWRQVIDRDPAHDAALRAARALYAERDQAAGVVHMDLALADLLPDDDEEKGVLLREAAQHLGALGRPQEAAEVWLRLRALQPDDAEAREALEAIYTAAGDWQALRALLQRILARTHDSESRLGLLLRIAELSGERLDDLAGARAAYEEALNESPGSPRATVALGALYRKAADWTAWVQLAMARLGDVQDAGARRAIYLEAAEVLEDKLGSVTHALALLGRSIQEHPDDGLGDTLGRLAEKLGKWPEVVRLYEASIKDAERADARAMHLRAAGWLEEKLGDRDRAVGHYRAMLALDAADEAALAALHRLFEGGHARAAIAEELARRHEKAGDWQRLHELLAAAVPESPATARAAAWRRLGALAAEKLGAPHRAFDWYARALVEVPDDDEARARLLSLAESLGRHDSLAGLFARALPRATRGVRPLGYALAEIYERLGDPEGAEEVYVSLLSRLGAAESAALAALEARYTATGRFAELAERLQAALAADPPEDIRADLATRLARVYEERLSRTAEAIQAWQVVLAVEPEDEEALAGLARLHQAQQDWAPLFEVYRREAQADASVRAARLAEMARIAGEHLGRPDDAVDLWRDALQAGSPEGPALQALQALLAGLGRSAELVEVIDRRLPLVGPQETLQLLRQKARLLTDQLEEPAGARASWEAVLKFLPDDLEALRALWQLLPAEEPQRLAEITGRLVARLPESAMDRLPALRAHARASDAIGDEASARRAWEGVKALAPDDAEAQDRLAELHLQVGDLDALVALREQQVTAAETDQERIERLIALAAVHDGQRQDSGGARDALERALAVRPEDDALAERILGLHVARGRFDAAADLLLRGVERATDPTERRRIRVAAAQRLQEAFGRPVEALSVLRGGFLADPHDADYGPALERVAQETGDWAALAALYEERIEQLAEQGPPPRLRLAGWYGERLDDDAAAIRHLQAIIAEEPDHGAAGSALAAALRRQARWGELFTLLSSRSAGVTGEEGQALRAEAAEVAFAHLDEDAQVGAWRLVLESDPSHRTALEALARLYRAREEWALLVGILGRQADAARDDEATALRLAIADLNADYLGDEDGAMAAYKRALALGPHNQTALAGVERVLTRRAAWDELVRFHEDRLAIAPPAERHAIYARIAEIQAEKQHNVAAARGTERVMRRSATARGRSTQALERVYIESNRWEDLAGLYERRLKVIAEGAPERSLRTTLATIYADKLGELDKAIEVLEPLIGADDVDHQEIRETLETLLVLHERREDWRGSIEVLKRLAKAQRSQDDRLSLYVRIGRVYADRLGEPVLATQWWREALEVDPHFKSALVAIDALHAKIKSEYDAARRQAEFERARLEAEEAERAAKARAEAEARLAAERAAQPQAADDEPEEIAAVAAVTAPAAEAKPPRVKRKRWEDDEPAWLIPAIGGAVLALFGVVVLWSVWPSGDRRLESTLNRLDDAIAEQAGLRKREDDTANAVAPKSPQTEPAAPETRASRRPEQDPGMDLDKEALFVQRMTAQLDESLVAMESALMSTGLDYEALLGATDPGNRVIDGPMGGPVMGEEPREQRGMVSPLTGPVRILSPFGPRGGENHDGIDLMAPEGTPVRTVAAGQITFIQDRDTWERRPKFIEEGGVRRTSGAWRAGVYLEITHDDGRVSRYMHLHDLAPGLVDGMRVQPKQVIGYVGRTAVEHSATHLHFEIRDRAPEGGRYGSATDPLPLIDLGGQAFVPELVAQKDLSRSPGGPELQQAVREKLRGLGPLEKMDRREALKTLIQQLPLAAPVDDYRLSSTFGRRIDPATGEPGFHPGVDMPGPLQTPVKATAPGTVVFAGWRGIYGRVIEIDHGNGILTRYGHLYSALVRPGQKVGAMEKIGEMGNSGRSTGEHLHYEVLVEGEPQDPLKFLQAGKFLFKG